MKFSLPLLLTAALMLTACAGGQATSDAGGVSSGISVYGVTDGGIGRASR